MHVKFKSKVTSKNVFIPRFLGSKLPGFYSKVHFSSNCATLFSFQFLMFKTIITLLSFQVLEFKTLNSWDIFQD